MPIIPSGLSTADRHCARILQTAIEVGDLATISQLLQSWPTQPDSENNSGDYVPDLWPFKAVLSGAIEKGNIELSSYVLDHGLKIELYAMMLALQSPSAGIFQVFVDHGWDINTPMGEKWPPCLAYMLEDENLTRWFLAHGASPNAPASRLFETPIMKACSFARLSIIKLLYTYGASHENVLQSAAESNAEGRLEVMNFLLDEGADINAIKWKHHEFSYRAFEGAYLGTALHSAVWGGFSDKVELLLKRGARVDIPDSMGHTSVDIARSRGRNDIYAMLSKFSDP